MTALYPLLIMECAFSDLIETSLSATYQHMSCGISTASALAYEQAIFVQVLGWGMVIFCLTFFVSMYFYD
jgi:hypothetical protein